MLITAGRVRALTAFAIAVAAVNVSSSLALTPRLGLDGVVLGTTVSFVLGFPFFVLGASCPRSTLPPRRAQLPQGVRLPRVPLTGVPVAIGLLAARLSLPLDTVVGVVSAALVALPGYWGIYYAVWLRTGERALVKAIALGILIAASDDLPTWDNGNSRPCERSNGISPPIGVLDATRAKSRKVTNDTPRVPLPRASTVHREPDLFECPL